MVISKRFYTEINTLQFVFGESCKLNRPLESLFDLGRACFLFFFFFFFFFLPPSIGDVFVCLCCLLLSTWPWSMTDWKCNVITRAQTNPSTRTQLLRQSRWLPVSICCGYKLKSVPLKSVTNLVHTAQLIAHFKDKFYIISFTNTPTLFILSHFYLLSSARRNSRSNEIWILYLHESVRPDT